MNLIGGNRRFIAPTPCQIKKGGNHEETVLRSDDGVGSGCVNA